MTDHDREQLEHWNGPGGERWVNEQARLDRVLEPLSRAAIAAAAPRPGERVIDIGCGCGGSTLLLAEAVGATGSALGVDISEPMLGLAKQRAAKLAHVRFERADAASYAFPGDADLLFSRFGCMFFGDAPRAYANLRRALAPDGRLLFMVWRPPAQNAWYQLPLSAAERALGHARVVPEPGAPGPFSLADADHTRALLANAGFSAIDVRPFDAELELSASGLDEAVAFAVQAGPISRLLLNYAHDAAAQARALDAARDALAPYLAGQRVALAAAVWLVSARV
jgi:SAM-dependent methyltransferase